MNNESYLVSHVEQIRDDHIILANQDFLPYSATVEAIVSLNQYLAVTHKLDVNHEVIRAGVMRMLETPQVGLYVLAWRPSDYRLLGKIEVKQIFEVLYNQHYQFLDNCVVSPEFQHQGIGAAILKYAMTVLNSPCHKSIRLYLSSHNSELKPFYLNRGFSDIGYMLECQ